MTATRRAAATRLVGLIFAVFLLAIQVSFSASAGVDPDEAEESRGRPMPRPDAPAEAVAFRQLQWKNEHGLYRVNGFVEAKAQADAMRAHARAARFPAAGPGQAVGNAVDIGDPGALPDATGTGPSSWTWLGPGNVGGRVRSLAIDPINTNVMFAGGVAGGLFKSTTGGASWAPVDDFMANLAISSIVMQPGLPTTLYAGTGEGFYNTDGIRGAGVFTSTDGGVTWSQLPATATANWWYVNRLSISPNAGVMLAATRSGIFRSTNGGASWTSTTATEMTYVAFHPTDSSRAIASGYAGDAYFSTNGGATWTPATGLPGGAFVRVELAYARSSPTTVYASVDVNGGSIYKSTNGGASFSAVFNGAPDYLATQGWYGNALWVDPTNDRTLIVGGVDLWKSTDGGVSLRQISNWAAMPASAHADQHVILEQPGFNGTSNTTVWFTNDGGVYKTDNVYTVGGGVAPYTSGWSAFNSNLGITQFYGAGGSTATGVILGGTQDNGTLKYTPATGTAWSTEFGGDGGASAVNPSNGNNMYGEYSYGSVHRSTDGGATADWINGVFWNGTQYECKPAPYVIADTCGASRANFVAPLVLDPNDSNRLFVGGASLWRTGDATTPNTAGTGPRWASVKGPAGTGNYISAVAVATGDANAIWVGHNAGQLFKTTNGLADAPTWTAVGAGTLPSRFVTRVRVDPANINTVYVTYGGFSAPNVWKTTDGGSSWVSASGSGVTGLPAAPVRDIAISALQPGSLFAATEIGIFTSQDSGSTWTVPLDGPANVSVEELFWMGPSLVAVTHGRGLFKTTPGLSRQTPVLTWPAPLAITYGTALDATQLNATANVPGTFAYTPPAGTLLPAGSGRTLSVVFTPADTASYDTATATVLITVNQATPTITWNAPAAITYGTPLSGAQLNATASVPGAFAYTPTAGTVLPAGTAQTLSVTFTPTDTANYIAVTRTVAITVAKATPALTWGTPANITYGTALTATQLNATASVPGTFVYAPPAGTVLPAGAAQPLSVTFTPTDAANYTTATASRTITVGKATPAIFWSTPANITPGTALSATQLNATSTVPGTFVYTPPAGTVLSAGSNQVLQVAFTPTDLADYTTATATVLINVVAAATAPTIDVQVWTDTATAQSTVASPAFSTTAANELLLAFVSTDYVSAVNTSVTGVSGAGLTWVLVGRSNAQRGTSEIWRAFAAAPLSGAIVTASLSQPVSSMITIVSFANVDTSGTSGSGAIGAMVATSSASGTPTATLVTTRNNSWVFGVGNDYDDAIARTLGSGQTMVHQYLALVADTFWVQRRTAVTALAGTSVTINDTAPLFNRYNMVIAEIRPPAVADTTAPTASLTAPADGATVSGATVTVSATASDNVGVAGVQFKLDGVALGAEDTSSPYAVVWNTTTAANGSRTLTAVARDSAGNTTTSAAVSVTVSNPVAITWTAPAAIVYGTPLSAAQLNATASVPGTFVYTPPAGTVLNAGAAQTLSVAFTPTDTINYSPASANVAITVLKVAPTLTWGAPANITYGMALGAAQLNATASVPGSFVYTPPLGTVLNAGASRTLSVAFTPTDTINYSPASASVAITVLKAAPTLSWGAPANITYGTALGATQLNATASVPGSFVYSPPAGTVLNAGAAQTLSVTFTPTDAVDYATASASVAISVLKASPTVSWTTPASITYGTALGAAQLNATASVPGTFVYAPPAGTVLAPGTQTLSVVFTPADAVNYTTASASVAIAVGQSTPTITWSAPADVTFGTPLGATQLNATASVPGAFVYTPPAGTLLNAGAAQTLSVAFTPTDAVTYSTATASVAITVLKALPALAWTAPANITYGTALGVTQLNATASVPGTLAYAPPAGTLLNAGAGQTLSVTFTPTDSLNYRTSTASVPITVGQATPTITWNSPAPIDPDTTLSAAQLNATANVTGTFVYTPPVGTVLKAGSDETLSVVFTPADAVDYTTASASVTISVRQATPTITWSGPADIVYGTALGATQLNAAASVPGTFVYSPPAGTVLSVGAQQPLSVTFTPTDAVTYKSVTVTAAITVKRATPALTWSAPANITYGTALGATQLNAAASVQGTFVYTPAAGNVLNAGAGQALSVTFTPADTANYATATAAVTITVLKAAPTIAWSAPASIAFGTALSATQLNATASVPGTFVYTPAAGMILQVGAGQALSVMFTPTDAVNYTPAAAAVTITVLKATPTITWNAPAPIAAGTALSAAQLNATASVPGTFVYTPPAGTVLSAGAGQLLSVTFTPADTVNYATATASVTISVGQATPAITWSAPASITYGTALSAAQLNATASVPGTFAYTPPAGSVPNAGAAQPLSVTFTPTDIVNYTTATASVAITVLKAAPTLSWNAPANITYGTALTVTQLNATASVPGTFAYAPPAGTVLPAGAAQPLSVTFTPTDIVNYTTATASRAITVLKATPAITWNAPAPIAAGTALSAAQLNATASVPGTFVYTPPAGTVLSAGAGQLLSVAFAPADTANYATATSSVTITVGQTTPTITWSGPANITYGTALSATQLNATASVPGTFVYTPPAGTVLPAGAAQPLSVAFTPSDSVNYAPASASVAITVLKAVPTLTWGTPANITYGTALTAAQLNATASVPGTFVYAPPAGTVLPAGAAQPLSVTFTPTDAANYTTATASRTITVGKATPAIFWSTPANITPGTALSATQLNATASVPGTFVYTPPAGTVLAAGNNQVLQLAFTPTDLADYTTATATVLINVVAAATAPTIDAQVWTDRATAQSTVVSPAFSTTAANELLLAFVGTDYGSGTNTSVTGVTGAGLTWVLVGRANAQAGTSEIWRAFAAAPLSGVTVTASLSQPVSSMITIVSFANVDTSGTNGSGAIGAMVAASSVSGTPTATLVTTRNNSWVFGVANDYDDAIARTLGSGQTMVHQYLALVADTFWVQRRTAVTALAGTSVTINDTAPLFNRYNMVIAEIRPPAAADTTAPTASLTAPANGATVSGTSVTVSAAASDNVGVAGVQFKLDGVALGAEDTSSPYAIVWNTTTAVNGSHTLTAVARDSAGNTATSAVVTVTVNNVTSDVTPPTVTMTAPAAGSIVLGPAVTVSATASDNIGVAGVQFLLDGVALGAETTAAPFTRIWSTTAVANGAHTLSARARDAANNQATSSVSVTVANPVTITWTAPAAIVYGTALSATQLNATASVPGTFVYTPPAGAVLNAGAAQVLSVTFTPTDIVNYSPATASVAITVVKASPALTWIAPANITYGVPLGASQLNAAASVPGAFVYTPPAGTVLSAGAAQALSVTFTPTDTVNYNTATASAAITVGQAAPVLTWSAPANIAYGTPLGAAQLNATANVPGAFVYTPAAGAVLNAGTAQVLSVTFTPTDTANYTAATASTAITVGQAAPVLTWGAPAAITYGTPLGASQLNAAANVPGTFVYTPAAGAVLNAGAAQALSVTFTPADTANYATATATVAITVGQAAPVLTWGAPAAITYGTPLGASQLNATASVPGTFVYTPAAGAMLNAGAAQALSVTFTPADTVNYSPATAATAIAVGKATPTVSWSAPASVIYGTPLGAAQLNATASVPGTFTYSPPAGTVLNAGAAQALSVTFTPADAANYTTATATTAITVGKATPTVSWSTPASITAGTPLGAAQLNATASVPGTFVYTPPAGTVLSAGAGQALSVIFTPTDTVNYTPVAAGVTITVLTVAAIPALDAVVWTDEALARSTITSPVFSTVASNELVLAFISTDYNGGTNTTVTSVTGAGLTWVLVARTNVQLGSSEIWRAFATAPLTGVTVTASMSQLVSSMMTVVSFSNVDTTGANGAGAIGATASANRASGAPTAALVTTRNNSWVFGVGNDFDHNIARTVGTGQTLVHQFLAPVGDTYWVQRTINPTPLAGTSVTINDTAPTTDRSNLTICEIRPPQ